MKTELTSVQKDLEEMYSLRLYLQEIEMPIVETHTAQKAMLFIESLFEDLEDQVADCILDLMDEQ